MSDLFQSVPFAVVLLIIGFVFLVKGADAFVEGCSSIARRYHVPSLIIGMTIVAMGTSLPETAVSVTAAITGNNALAVSNAVGSNIFNLMVVVGACTLFTSVAVQVNTLKIDFPISILCAVLLLILGAAGMSLGHIDGVMFIILFLAFILYMIRSAQTSREKNVEPGVEEEEYLLEAEEIQEMSMGKSVIYIILGAVAIAVGSDWVVDGACTVAAAIGISQTLIGLTVVAFGTSLPELVTSIVAARKGEVDMALGNVIGSNIFNILMVLGIAAAISPVAFLTENIIDIAVLIVFSVLGWIMAWTKKELNRKGLAISRQVICNWFVRCARQYLEPVFQRMEQDIRKSSILNMDETTLLCLQERKNGRESKSYEWLCMTNEYEKNQMALYYGIEYKEKS